MEQTPGMLQAIVNLLRRGGGRGPQQTQGRAVDLMPEQRRVQMEANSQGMTPEEYMAAQQQQQQMPVSTPR